MLHRPRNSGRELVWCNGLLCGSALVNLSLVQSSRSIQRMQTVQIQHKCLSYTIISSNVGPVNASQTKKLRERIGLVQQTPLWVRSCAPISRSKLKIYSVHADSPHSKQMSILYNFDVGPVYASQTKKLCERIGLVQQTPLWVRSCAPISHSKFKIHSAHADSPHSKQMSILYNFDMGPVYASQTKKLRERIYLVQ